MKFLKLLTTLLISITTILLSILPAQAQDLDTLGIDINNLRNITGSNPDQGRVVIPTDYTITLTNQPTQSGRINLKLFQFSENFSDTITTEDYTISLNGQKNTQYLNYTATRTKKNYYCDSSHNTQLFTVPLPTTSIFDTTEIYNAKVKVQYTECTNKDPITAYFTPIEVQYGATTWNLTLHTTEKATIDQQQLQYWTQKFNIHSIVNSGDNMIIISITSRLQDRLEDIECTTYNLTIPRNALTSTETRVKNTSDIIGEFRVTNCPPPATSSGENGENDNEAVGTDTENSTNSGSTMKEGNIYLSLFDKDENGKEYLNLTNTVYLFGFITFFIVIFFLLFAFLKNSFLGKSKKY